ncbi:MAG: hypothetical protein R3A12_01960 [Ignavibacteria bacterium]
MALLDKHPLFEVTEIAASERSAGSIYENTVNCKPELNDIPGKNCRNEDQKTAHLILTAKFYSPDLTLK